MSLKLKREHKRAWLKALRSGDYQQARYDLMDHDGKCCGLGVGLDVLLDDWWIQIPEIINGGNPGWCPQSMMKDDDDPLTMIVSEWFRKPRGKDEEEFCDSVDFFIQGIIALNDHNKLSFGGIADFIEKKF